MTTKICSKMESEGVTKDGTLVSESPQGMDSVQQN